MLAHALYDSSKMAVASFTVHSLGKAKVLEMATDPNAAAHDVNPVLTVVGLALLLGAYFIIATSQRFRDPKAFMSEPAPVR